MPKPREHTPGKEAKSKGERTPHQSAPELIARMAVMNADFIASLPRVMMTNCDNWRKKHVIARRHTLQSVVRLLVHVEKSGLEPGQLKISRSTQYRTGVRKRPRQIVGPNDSLRKCVGIHI